MGQEVTAGNVAAVLKEKADKSISGLLPGCELKCEVGGFPPKLECRVVCG